MRPQKITFGEMREMGVRGVLVYCADYRCSHSVALSADAWPDDLRLSDIEDASSARGVGGVAPTSGRISRRRKWAAKAPAGATSAQGRGNDERALSNRSVRLFEMVRLEPMRPAVAAAETDHLNASLNIAAAIARDNPVDLR
jgi:hypothetical protein